MDARAANRSFQMYESALGPHDVPEGRNGAITLDSPGACFQQGDVGVSQLHCQPPPAPSSHQAQLINRLAAYSQDTSQPSHVSVGSQTTSPTYLLSPFEHDFPKHRSIASQSSGTSSLSGYDKSDKSVYNHLGVELAPSTPSSARSAVGQVENRGSRDVQDWVGENGSVLGRADSRSTGSSSKKAAKAELKAMKEAEKLMKKAEARAKFEILRDEQKRKLSIARAEAQRKAEIEANKKPVVEKQAPKSKLGKFGQKFTDAVLFPAAEGTRL